MKLSEVKKPVPKDNEVLIKTFASSVNYGNLVLLKGEPFLARFAFGLLKPKYPIPGGDIAGRVEAVGKNITQFKPGDDVFGDLSSCGWGAFAEYVSVPVEAIALKPTNISFEEAAAAPMAGVTALQSIQDKGKLKEGEKILINGASGGVGTFAVQIAKALGAEVTGVCSTSKIETLRSLGADYVIDYTKEDFTTKKEKYDLILGVNGYQSINAYKRALKPNGRYVMVGGSGAQLTQAMLFGPLFSATTNKKMGSMLQRANQKDLLFLQKLLDSNKVKPVIEQCYPLTEVHEAFRHFEKGSSYGKIVITM